MRVGGKGRRRGGERGEGRRDEEKRSKGRGGGGGGDVNFLFFIWILSTFYFTCNFSLHFT